MSCRCSAPTCWLPRRGWPRGTRISSVATRRAAPASRCAPLATNLRDAVLVELVQAALADLGEDGPNGLLAEIALVAHGGHGRRDVAPYSDVDLMILHRRAAAARVAPLAERLLRDVSTWG